LKSIQGIGTVLASRIFRFREKLGVFVSPNQLYEVYGLDSLVVSRLLETAYFEDDFVPAQININTCSENELSSHPYVSKPIAKAIVAYRFQHGHFNAVEDIRQIKLVDAAIFSKISPYLTIALNGDNQKGQ
jgi:competence ComEA-like helix-hairpin-helix protein